MSLFLQQASIFKNSVIVTDTEIFVEVTADRTASDVVDWTATATLSQPAGAAINIVFQVEKVNGLGANWGVNLAFASGEITKTDTRNETNCNVSEFVATVKENISFPPPAGYVFQNLPFGVTVPVYVAPPIVATISATPTRTSFTDVGWEVTATFSAPSNDNFEIYMLNTNNNGFGSTWNPLIQVTTGGTVFTRSNTPFANCNPAEYTATMTEYPGFPLPNGYAFGNLPFNTVVPAYTILGWNVSTGVFAQKQSVAANASVPNSVVFSEDGLKMIVLDDSTDSFVEYNLGTAWDVSTASFVQSQLAVIGTVNGLFASQDGLNLYVIAANTIYQQKLTTPWDVSTVSFFTSKNISAQDSNITGGFIDSTGTIVFATGSANNNVYKYTLSTAFNIASATFVESFSVATEENTVRAVFFRPTGLQMYILGHQNDTVYEYHLTTAWSLTSASYSGRSLPVGSQLPSGVFWRRSDGLKMYIVDADATDQSVYEYDIDP